MRKIEIKTRGLSQEIFAGEYHSAFKGRGMTFSEVREYQYGDDVRDIDWNVTARYHKPFVKVYEEERELTVMLVVDVSAGNLFGAVGPYKRDVVAEVAATLAFSAIQNNDKVGMLLFTDRIEHSAQEGSQAHPAAHPRVARLPSAGSRHQCEAGAGVHDRRVEETLHNVCAERLC